MIIKGTSCAGASRLTTHLTRTDTNERAEVIDIRGVVADNLSGALHEMEAVATGARTAKPFYHGSINTRADERLTDEQRMYAIDRLEATLGLTGQARVVVIHEKEGREHCHIVWSRIDLDRMAAISDSNNYRRHEEVARSLEREFGHERVQGALVEREGKARPERTPSHREMLQSERTGISTEQAKELMTGIWKTTKNGKEFQAALEDKGWMLARGDRRDFVAIDPHGGVHSIARRVKAVKAADVRQRFADLDPRTLSTVAEAKQVQRQRHGGQERHTAKQRVSEARPPRKAAGHAQGSKPARGARMRPSPGKVADALFSALMGEKPAPKPKEADKAPHVQEAAQPSQRRQELMRQLSRFHPRPRGTPRSSAIEGESATGGNGPGAGAAPVPNPRQPRSKPGFAPAGRRLTKRGFVFDALYARFREAKDDLAHRTMPLRPMAHGGMSLAQLADLNAAIEGKITWAEYFRKWGGGNGPSL